MICPRCHNEASKIIYAGFPAKLCFSDECHLLWGFWSITISLLPFNGIFYIYEGNYFKGLLGWWREMATDE